jgi:anti-sigma-K factor RskA
MLKERYSRGRGEERLVDEYILGSLEVEKQIDIPAGKSWNCPSLCPSSG